MNDLVKHRLQEITQSNGGRLTPDAVVTDARRKDSPLHELFEWDVKKAAAAHWIERAREIIRSVNIEIKTDSITFRAPLYIRDPAAEKEQGYREITEVRSDVEAAREALLAEFGRVGDLLRRAKAIARVLQLEPELESLIANVDDLRVRVGERIAA